MNLDFAHSLSSVSVLCREGCVNEALIFITNHRLPASSVASNHSEVWRSPLPMSSIRSHPIADIVVVVVAPQKPGGCGFGWPSKYVGFDGVRDDRITLTREGIEGSLGWICA